jgi:predicted Zn-dependent protease
MEPTNLTLIDNMYRKNPKDTYLAFAAANQHHKAGNTERAIEICKDLIKTNKNFADSYFELGQLYEKSNQTAKAIGVYKTGLTIALASNNDKIAGKISETLMFLED